MKRNEQARMQGVLWVANDLTILLSMALGMLRVIFVVFVAVNYVVI